MQFKTRANAQHLKARGLVKLEQLLNAIFKSDKIVRFVRKLVERN
jgi:hypothetical protein